MAERTNDGPNDKQLDLFTTGVGILGGIVTSGLGYSVSQVVDMADRVEGLVGSTMPATNTEYLERVRNVLAFYVAELEKSGRLPSAPPHVDSPEHIRDAVLRNNTNHEARGCANSPPGQVCWHDRCNMVAYIAHCLGVRGQRLMEITASIVGDYDKVCRDRRCKHSDN